MSGRIKLSLDTRCDGYRRLTRSLQRCPARRPFPVEIKLHLAVPGDSVMAENKVPSHTSKWASFLLPSRAGSGWWRAKGSEKRKEREEKSPGDACGLFLECEYWTGPLNTLAFIQRSTRTQIRLIEMNLIFGGNTDLLGVRQTRKIIYLISASHKQPLATLQLSPRRCDNIWAVIITLGKRWAPGDPGTWTGFPGSPLICLPHKSHIAGWLIDLFLLRFDFIIIKK